ncbi:DUF6428 family protein [Phyllobacterium zundukense]|jgi:hypothetical protein|uniref:DUF6428 family protein n=1 Tax=Phyllobacterium zundukense TaxID=1867719 RepID=A0ACD4D1J1_9HYPH|nr:DUF6428 family protein [Phyllobacterium zundukense]UXN59657.1 DUF6428 family protein [Phyllobacterium zundukense]
MDTITSPVLIEFYGDGTLAGMLAAMEPHADKSFVIEYGGRTIQSGYHVTEVRAGSFVTLDCGGNPDQWHETILQVEDLPSQSGRDFMKVSKFRGILTQVANQIELDAGARLTFEVGTPDTPMQVFDISTLAIESDRIVLALVARPAICKPRHRRQKRRSLYRVLAQPRKARHVAPERLDDLT